MGFTPEILARLETFGVKSPGASKWKRSKPVYSETICYIEIVCLCPPKWHKRVAMIPFDENGKRPIFVGQCSECGTVYWCDWLTKVRNYTGRRVIETRPMYPPSRAFKPGKPLITGI